MTEQIRAKVEEISEMGEQELYRMAEKVSFSDVSTRVKWHIYEAIDKRMLQLRGLHDQQGVQVVCSELRMGEI